jgi:hypothetical protein
MPISIGRAFIEQALTIMHEEEHVHYDFRCPKCKKANRVSREQLEHAAPGWIYEPSAKKPETDAPETPKKQPEAKQTPAKESAAKKAPAKKTAAKKAPAKKEPAKKAPAKKAPAKKAPAKKTTSKK